MVLFFDTQMRDLNTDGNSRRGRQIERHHFKTPTSLCICTSSCDKNSEGNSYLIGRTRHCSYEALPLFVSESQQCALCLF